MPSRTPLPTARAAALAALLAPGAAACVTRAAHPAADAAPRAATVLVYNMHAGKDAAGVDNLARVAALVREVGADVVLLQEVDSVTRRSGGVDQTATLARLTGMHAAFGSALRYDGGGYGIAVLSRWPVRHDTLVRLPVSPPQARSGGAYEPRGALVARLDAPGGPLTVVTTHLDASRGDEWRRQEVRTVVALARTLGAGGARLLVGGDFNAEPGSAVIDSAAAGGLRDAWTACGRGDGLTYPAGTGVKRIDYLFLTGSASCDEARVVPSAASDHSPLLVRVRWAGAGRAGPGSARDR